MANADGGVFYLAGASDFVGTITSCNMYYNYANSNGGVFSAQNTGTFKITTASTTLDYHYAQQRGGYISQGASGKDFTFISTSTTWSRIFCNNNVGGMADVATAYPVSISFTGGSLNDVHSNAGGGAFYSSGSTLSLTIF
jgi:hypothetical protein